MFPWYFLQFGVESSESFMWSQRQGDWVLNCEELTCWTEPPGVVSDSPWLSACPPRPTVNASPCWSPRWSCCSRNRSTRRRWTNSRRGETSRPRCVDSSSPPSSLRIKKKKGSSETVTRRFTLTSELLSVVFSINYSQLNIKNKTFCNNTKDKNTKLTSTVITIMQRFKQKYKNIDRVQFQGLGVR